MPFATRPQAPLSQDLLKKVVEEILSAMEQRMGKEFSHDEREHILNNVMENAQGKFFTNRDGLSITPNVFNSLKLLVDQAIEKKLDNIKIFGALALKCHLENKDDPDSERIQQREALLNLVLKAVLSKKDGIKPEELKTLERFLTLAMKAIKDPKSMSEADKKEFNDLSQKVLAEFKLDVDKVLKENATDPVVKKMQQEGAWVYDNTGTAIFNLGKVTDPASAILTTIGLAATTGVEPAEEAVFDSINTVVRNQPPTPHM